jgi:hypothetical protein
MAVPDRHLCDTLAAQKQRRMGRYRPVWTATHASLNVHCGGVGTRCLPVMLKSRFRSVRKQGPVLCMPRACLGRRRPAQPSPLV